MRNILTSVSPNLENDDAKLALKQLFSPWNWFNPHYVKILTDRLLALYPNRHAILTSSGRSALYAVLAQLKLRPDDEVIIQAFTCVTVPAAIQWAGGKPVYADIKPRTYNLDPESVLQVITSHTKAIIIQHTLGLPADLSVFQEIARQHNIFLIEDCAHAFGASYAGQLVGSFGDAAILSFGRDKALSGVFGGTVITPNSDFADKIRAAQASLPLPPVWWIIQQLLHPLVSRLVIPLYFTSKIGRIILVISQKLNLISKAVTPSERTGAKPSLLFWRMSPALAILTSHQLDKLLRFTSHRRHIAQIYLDHLANPPIIPTTAEPSWLRFPLTTKYPRRLHMQARRLHILLGDWYDAPIAPRTVNPADFGYQSGSCPVAESTARRIVNLPTNIFVTESDAHRLIHLIQNHVA